MLYPRPPRSAINPLTTTLALLLSATTLLPSSANAQTDNSPVSTQFSDPTGKACASGTGAIYALTGTLYTCQSGVFATASVASGGLAPFTTDGINVYLTSGNLSVGTTVPVAVADGCPVLTGANQICVKRTPYYASGSAATTSTAGTTSPGTSVVVADASSFSKGQGIYIAGAGAVDGIGGTITYTSGGTATGTGYCIATPASGGGYNGQASIAVASDVLSGTLTIIAQGQGYASIPTSWTLSLPQGAAATACSGTIATTGGSLVAANYTGTISNIAGATLTITPATTTAVSSGAVVQHDESVAFQSAIDALATTGGKIVVPDGFYRINAPPRNPTQANAVLIVPAVKYNTQDFGEQVGIELAGMSQPAYDAPASAVVVRDTGAIIQSNNTSGSIIGGWANIGTGTLGNMTDVLLTVRNLTFRAYMAPSVTLINASRIASLILEGTNGDVGVSAWNTGYTKPVSPNGRFVVTPNSNNGAQVILHNTQASGFYIAYSVSEHCYLLGVQPMTNHIAVEIRAAAHALYGTKVLAQWNDYAIYVSGIAVLTLDALELEHVANSVELYDPLNYLHGSIPMSISGGVTPPTIVGGANVLVTMPYLASLNTLHPPTLGGLSGWVKGGIVHGTSQYDKIGMSWTGSSVVLTPPTAATGLQYGGLVYPGTSGYAPASAAFNFTGRTVSVKVSSVCKGVAETLFTITPTGTNASRVWMQTYNGTIYFYKESGVVASATYSPITHAYWRLREASGTIYGDTSADGVTWTNLGSTTVAWAYTSVAIALEVGVGSALAYPGFGQFDLLTIQ